MLKIGFDIDDTLAEFIQSEIKWTELRMPILTLLDQDIQSTNLDIPLI